MNLGVIEAQLLPVVQRAVAADAVARAGPPVQSPVTGMKFDVWVHAARFEDVGGITSEGAFTARRPARLRSNLSGFVEQRPACIGIEVTCTGPTCAGVQTICGALSPAVLLALETMPWPVLSSPPNESVVLRFADFTTAVRAAASTHRRVEDAGYFMGVVTFQLDGFLHVTVARRGGVTRPSAAPPGEAPVLVMRVVPGPAGAEAADEHVVITNGGADRVRMDGFVLRDAAARPRRFVIPEFNLAPGASVRVWTRKGRNDAENLHWGRAKPVWNEPGATATLLDVAGEPLARADHPRSQRPRKRGSGRTGRTS
jgi:hypothetical protein